MIHLSSDLGSSVQCVLELLAHSLQLLGMTGTGCCHMTLHCSLHLVLHRHARLLLLARLLCLGPAGATLWDKRHTMIKTGHPTAKFTGVALGWIGAR